MKHLGLSHSMERWLAPQLEHGYAFFVAGDGVPDVGVTSLGGCCG
jgi:hypothetical protein